MTAKYLLPCRCGREVAIEPPQAGQLVQCACGASLEVPTMLGLSCLKTAPPVVDSDASGGTKGWGWHHRLVLFGMVILVGAAVGAAYWYVTRPIPPKEQVRSRIAELSALNSLRAFEALREQGLYRGRLPEDTQYDEAVFRYHAGLAVAAFFALGGLGLIVAGVLRKRRSGPAQK